MELSKLSQIIDLNEDTPHVVLQEICVAHRIPVSENLEELLEAVRQTPIGTVSDPVEESEWGNIARYVNPNCGWKQNELEIAFRYIQRWEKTNLQVPPLNFSFGSPTPENLESLNACILYKFCRNNGIITHYNHTLYQLASLVKMITRDTVYARSMLTTQLGTLNSGSLHNLYSAAMYYFNEQEIPLRVMDDYELDYPAIETCIETFTNKQALRSRIQPVNHAEAITLAALNFFTDISAALNPANEYEILRRNPSEYKPRDEKLIELLAINPRLLDMKEYFNPRLPADLYNEEDLRVMALTEGYGNSDIRSESAYTLLQTARLTDTFYHGTQPGIQNARTPFYYEPIDELHPDQIVCYGVHGTQMTAFQYAELAELFTSNKNFINPLKENSEFSGFAVKKLKNLCKKIRGTEDPAILAERRTLHNAILNTELFTDAKNQKARALYEVIHQCDEIIRDKIFATLQALLNLSMYMRGWLGEGSYPIESAPVYDQISVDLKVTEGIYIFENLCFELGDVGRDILNLPLLKYSSGVFVATADSEHGYTILDRLNIVRNGDNNPGYESCIRISSNLLAASAWRYMQVAGMPEPFNVDQLRSIS